MRRLRSSVLQAAIAPTLVVLASVVVFVAAALRQNISVQLLLSVAVACITLVIVMLTATNRRVSEMDRRIEEMASATRESIAEGLAKMSEATELFGAVEASAVRTDAVLQLVRSSTMIPPEPSLIARLSQAEIARVAQFLGDLSRGRDAVYEGEDRDWLLGLARNAQLSIDATSLTTVDVGGRGLVDDGLWLSDLGSRLLEAQREAGQRGVRLRRIFVMDRPELLSDQDFLYMTRLHRDMGIEVRILDPSLGRTSRSSLFEFTVFDGAVSYETAAASRIAIESRPTIVSTRLVLEPARVRERLQRFEDLWRGAAQPPEG